MIDENTEFGRTLTLRLGEPWLLGWCRWSIETELRALDASHAVVETLASGRWKWRGRNARYVETTLDCSPDWCGPEATYSA